MRWGKPDYSWPDGFICIKSPPPPTVSSTFADSIRKLFRMAAAPAPAPQPRITLCSILRRENPPQTMSCEYNSQGLWDALSALDLNSLRVVMRDVVLVDAQHMKMSKRWQHEYMSFTAKINDDDIGCIEVQRRPGKKIASSSSSRILFPWQFLRQPNAVQSRPPATLLERAASASPGFVAEDVAKVTTNPSSSLQPASPVSSPISPEQGEEPWRVHYICAAMEVIHQDAPIYRLVCHQCYWFSAVVRFLITGKRPQGLRKALLKDGKRVKSRAGKHGSAIIVNTKSVEKCLIDIRAAYRAEVVELTRRLDEKLDQARIAAEERAQEAQQLRAAEERAAQEAERARAAEERATEEAERARAAEERATGEAERARAAEERMAQELAEERRKNAELMARISARDAS